MRSHQLIGQKTKRLIAVFLAGDEDTLSEEDQLLVVNHMRRRTPWFDALCARNPHGPLRQLEALNAMGEILNAS